MESAIVSNEASVASSSFSPEGTNNVQLSELSSGIVTLTDKPTTSTVASTPINLGGDSQQQFQQPPLPPTTMQQQQFYSPQVPLQTQQIPQLPQQPPNIYSNVFEPAQVPQQNVQSNVEFCTDPTTTSSTDSTINNNELQLALPEDLIDVYNHLGLIGRLLTSGSLATIKVLQVCRNLGENLADAFGITRPKYEYEVNMYNQMKKENEDKEEKLNQMYATWQPHPPPPPPSSGNVPIFNAADLTPTNATTPTIDPVNPAQVNMETQVQFSSQPTIPSEYLPPQQYLPSLPQYLPPQQTPRFAHPPPSPLQFQESPLALQPPQY